MNVKNLSSRISNILIKECRELKWYNNCHYISFILHESLNKENIKSKIIKGYLSSSINKTTYWHCWIETNNNTVYDLSSELRENRSKNKKLSKNKPDNYINIGEDTEDINNKIYNLYFNDRSNFWNNNKLLTEESKLLLKEHYNHIINIVKITLSATINYSYVTPFVKCNINKSKLLMLTSEEKQNITSDDEFVQYILNKISCLKKERLISYTLDLEDNELLEHLYYDICKCDKELYKEFLNWNNFKILHPHIEQKTWFVLVGSEDEEEFICNFSKTFKNKLNLNI